MLHQQSEKAEKNHTEKKHTLLGGLIEIQYHHSNNLAILDSQDLCTMQQSILQSAEFYTLSLENGFPKENIRLLATESHNPVRLY